jgi:predicted SnoaL-like aldol condensation-catalyzing enzyme
MQKCALLFSFSLLLISPLVTAAVGASKMLPDPSTHQLKRDLQQENANLELVYRFYNQFFNQHKTVEAAKVVSENYKQHNPYVADGRKAFVDYFSEKFKSYPQSRAIISQYGTFGDRVFLRVESKDAPNSASEAVVDIFRVKDGKIVEHWDSVQTVPANPANNNSMF